MPRLAAVTMATGSGVLNRSAQLPPKNCQVSARGGVVDLGEHNVEPRNSEQRDARVGRMRAIEKLYAVHQISKLVLTSSQRDEQPAVRLEPLMDRAKQRSVPVFGDVKHGVPGDDGVKGVGWLIIQQVSPHQ